MDAANKLTSKGQVIVPKAVRDAFGRSEGDEIIFAWQQPSIAGLDAGLPHPGRNGLGTSAEIQRRVG